MGATAAAIGEFFAGASGAAGAGAAGAAGGAVAGTGLAAAALEGAAGAVGAGVATALLAPDAPELQKPGVMPDPLETQKARERSIIEQMARRGRAASILTNSGSGTSLGG